MMDKEGDEQWGGKEISKEEKLSGRDVGERGFDDGEGGAPDDGGDSES